MISAPSLCSVAMLKSSPDGSPSAGNWFCARAGGGSAGHSSASATAQAVRRRRNGRGGTVGTEKSSRGAGMGVAMMPHKRFEDVSPR